MGRHSTGIGLVALGLIAGLAAGALPARAGVPIVTPDWAKRAVFYQIFPERFCNGDRHNDPPGTRPWGTEPAVDNYMGGDLDGVIQRLPYLQELGVTALYFNPIFTSDSNHKYHTVDYMHVDPHFGGDGAFKRLIAATHRAGMKVILDGVFNHSGDSHPFFLDAARRGPASPYWSWYHFDGFPVVKAPKPNYEAWWGLPSLPKLQVASNSVVANYVYQVEEHWLKLGIDGWRLDVPNEIDSDAFWRGFRRRAKAINSQAYLVGEIWDPAQRWLQGDQFDAVMNYPWRDRMVRFFAKNAISAEAFDDELVALRAQYALPITQVMFNVLDSHDTMRFLTEAGGEVSRLKLAVLFQMTYVGVPVIYYGDEIGMQGGKDPDDRRCFPEDPRLQDRGLFDYYRKLIALRRSHPALQTGSFRTLRRDGKTNTLAFVRQQGEQAVVVALNNGPDIQELDLNVQGIFADGEVGDALSGKRYAVARGHLKLKLDPRTGLVLPSAS